MTKIVHYRPFTFHRPSSRDILWPFEKALDEMFRDNFPELTKSFGIAPFSNESYPKVNVIDFDDRVEIVSELAGYSKEDVSVEVDNNNVLCISGVASTKEEKFEDSRYIIRELKRSNFSRSFTLNEQLDPKGVEAKFENGLLTVTIKKTKKDEPEVRQKVKIQ